LSHTPHHTKSPLSSRGRDIYLAPISSYLTLNNIVTSKSGIEVTRDYSNWCHSKAWVRFSTRLL